MKKAISSVDRNAVKIIGFLLSAEQNPDLLKSKNGTTTLQILQNVTGVCHEAQMSRIMHLMGDKKWITRALNPRDKRQIDISVTEEGRKFFLGKQGQISRKALEILQAPQAFPDKEQEFAVLRLFHSGPKGGYAPEADTLPLKTIREELGLKPAVATRWVKRFEDEGLIRESKDNVDHRQMNLTITPQGRRHFRDKVLAHSNGNGKSP